MGEETLTLEKRCIHMEKVEQYPIQIPLMLRQTFKAFASDNRSNIIEILFNNNKPLTFSEIKQAVNLDQRVLTDELKKLISGSVVDHYTEYRDGVKRHSYYELTEYGAKILKASLKVLFESYEPTIKLEATKEKEPSVDSGGRVVNLDDASINSADSPNLHSRNAFLYSNIETAAA